ncbi:hypothetical protein QG37_07154 [Candidozyma auris]|nr:hypothetical protein QG37_07154 [[Candida] auris]
MMSDQSSGSGNSKPFISTVLHMCILRANTMAAKSTLYGRVLQRIIEAKMASNENITSEVMLQQFI